MERFCAYQERCHKEVVAKLRQMRMIPEAIDLILTHLIEDNYLNEERFARSFARGKFRFKKWGRVRITRELKLRAISRYNIACAMEEIEEDYDEAGLPTLLGLYDGVPLTERDEGWSMVLPDRILIFRGPLERWCTSREELEEEITVTVIHEVAHHFGIPDERLHELGWE